MYPSMQSAGGVRPGQIPPAGHPETATEADGTHPTGMHSCNVIVMD